MLVEDLRRLGAVGEERTAKLVLLQVVSRVFPKIVSLAIKGASSGGKSYTVECVLRLCPASAFYTLTAMSERSLAYDEEPLSHRILVLFEAAGLTGDLASYLVRSLLSEGCIRYSTVEKTSEGLRGRLIERPGPTGLLVTTTALNLHPENETRLLSVPIDDTPDQTRRVLAKIAEDVTGDGGANVEAWHALQTWLEAGERRVVVPYAGALAKAIPPAAVRLRRDFTTLLRLVEAHALLHRATRTRDGAGRIVATLNDYDVVRGLVVDLMGAAVERSVPTSVRETVDAVAELLTPGVAEVSVKALADRLKLDRTAAYRRARDAESRGYLVNHEDKKGKPGRYVLGEQLPSESDLLPTAEVLRDLFGPMTDNGCSVAAAPGGVPKEYLSDEAAPGVGLTEAWL
jgi:hypothetical protein